MNTRVAARVILLNEKKEILLLKFSVKTVFWLTPGGKIEDGESALQAAQREMHEETGIDPDTVVFCPVYTYYESNVVDIHGTQTLLHEHFFLARTTNPVIHRNNLQEDEKKFMLGHQWWNVNSLAESDEILCPGGLLAELQRLMAQS